MQLLVPDDVGLVLALAMMIANGNGAKCVELILIPHPGCRAYDGVVGARVSRPNPPSRGVVLSLDSLAFVLSIVAKPSR